MCAHGKSPEQTGLRRHIDLLALAGEFTVIVRVRAPMAAYEPVQPYDCGKVTRNGGRPDRR